MHTSTAVFLTAIGLVNAQQSSSYSANAASCSSSFIGTIVQPSGQPQITACANSLPLGATCGASEQCTGGAQCWASNAGLIRRCGNFNAACTRDDQCAYNTCNNGLCNGLRPSGSSSSYAASSTTSSSASASATCAPPGQRDSQGRYSCNPAHAYPAGNTCVFVNGCPVLVTGSTSTTTTSSGSSQPSCAPAGSTDGQGRYSCNPAHQYPAGNTCSLVNGCYVLVTGGASSTTSMVTSTSTKSGNGTAPTGSITPPYTGSAASTVVMTGAVALVAGVVAFVL